MIKKLKENKTGFTLIELIVVIAIIGILAAILVPSMLGFMRDAKYASANATSKTIHTSMSAVVAKYNTTHKNLPNSAGFVITESTLSAVKIGSATFDLSQYMAGFKGRAVGALTPNGSRVDFVVWSMYNPGNFQITQEQQDDGTAVDTKGNVIGCFPFEV